MRVLIADDSRLVVERLVTALAKVRGIEIVGQAGTAAETTEGIQRLRPDIVILDICMPEGSGIDVIEDLKKDPSAPVVIVLTNHAQPQYRKKCLASGAAFFFDKSAEFENVVEVLRNLVANVPASGRTQNGRAEHEKACSQSPSRARFESGGPPRHNATITTEKPKLLISKLSEGEPVYYLCSYCLRGFLLADNQPPIQAAREMYRCFREHVKQKHPEPGEGPATASAA